MSVASAEGHTDFLASKYTGDKEANLFLVVVADSVDPVSFVFLSWVHVVHKAWHVVHGPPVFHLAGFVVQVGDGLVEGLAVSEL